MGVYNSTVNSRKIGKVDIIQLQKVPLSQMYPSSFHHRVAENKLL